VELKTPVDFFISFFYFGVDCCRNPSMFMHACPEPG